MISIVLQYYCAELWPGVCQESAWQSFLLAFLAFVIMFKPGEVSSLVDFQSIMAEICLI